MRIELTQSGHIQIREIRDGKYHRSVKYYTDDLSELPESCNIVILEKNQFLANANVKEVIADWSKDGFPEIKAEL